MSTPRSLASALQSLAPLGDPAAIAQIFARIHDQGGPHKALAEALPAVAREALSTREARLRSEARLTDKVIDEVLARAPAPPTAGAVQQRLRLRTSPGEPAEGRFVVDNARARPAAVRFRCSEAVEAQSGEALWLPVRLHPPRPELAPGGEVVVRLRIDTDEPALRSGQRYDIDVDVLLDGEPALRLAVELSLVEAPR